MQCRSGHTCFVQVISHDKVQTYNLIRTLRATTTAKLSHTMNTFLSYLARDELYEKEKSFSTDFAVDHIPGARATNGKTDERLVSMHDIHTSKDITFDTAGFCLANFHSQFSADDLVNNGEEAKLGYWKEIQQLILSTFPEYQKVECYDLTVRIV